MIRDCTPDDVTWVLERARDAYAGLVDGWDDTGARAWIEACIADPAMIVMRGRGTVGFAQVFAPPWSPGVLVCDLVHLFGRGEPMAVFDAINRRRKVMGVSRMYVGSVFADISPLAKRRGGRPLNVTYVMET